MLQRVIFTLFLLSATATAQAPVDGATAYATRCAVCHGGDGNGSERAPGIVSALPRATDAQLGAIIRLGTEGGMPPQPMPDAELAVLVAHLRTMQPPARRGRGPRRATIGLSDGTQVEGLVIGESSFDINIRTDDGKTSRFVRQGTSETFSRASILPKKDWVDYDNGDNNRYLDAAQINRDNVRQLGLKWMFPVLNHARLENTPVVVDGIMYVTGWNEAWALDAVTGRRIWTYGQDRSEGLISEAGRSANRGVALNDDYVFMVTDHAHLLALDRWTGEKVWDTEMADYKQQYAATAAPLVVGDLVISGVAGGEEGIRGFLDAYDVKTGKQAWRFWTIPTRDDPEAATWIGTALEHGCGATWLTGAYDAGLDLLYWTVGNPCPDYDGSQRLGEQDVFVARGGHFFGGVANVGRGEELALFDVDCAPGAARFD
jgi:alcohol dehydrogenase (cytochrome c)